MANVLIARLFGRSKRGDREEVRMLLFNPDGTPFAIGGLSPGQGGSSVSVLDAWKGAWDPAVDYEAGSLVRKDGSTYLALGDASHSGPVPGGVVAAVVKSSDGDRAGYDLPRDVVAVIANLNGDEGWNLGGTSRWFRMSGTPGEVVTVSAVGGNIVNMLHFYGPTGDETFMGTFNYTSPTEVTIPAEGYFYVEVNAVLTSVKYVGPNGPQPLPENPWTVFA